jgi:glyoxylase-like metal-dependent hydrolase (beta-lactamase superfamily II)
VGEPLRITRIAERVYLLDTNALGQPGTVATYLLRGSKLALVDCGYASSYQNILDLLGELGITPAEISYLIPTHVHLDHAGATGHLLQRMRNARVVAHRLAAPHLIDPRKLIESATRVFGQETMQLYGSPLPIEADKVIEVDDEFFMDLGDGLSITALYTPGHAPHQISLRVEEPNLLITADAVGIIYPNVRTLIPTTPPPSFNPDQALSTLDRLVQLQPKALLLPHFGARGDAQHVFDTTRMKISAWVSEVERLRNSGRELEDIVMEVTRRVADEVGGRAEDLPSYARQSIRVSVMGILHYLKKR